jgi:hypothetical protein
MQGMLGGRGASLWGWCQSRAWSRVAAPMLAWWARLTSRGSKSPGFNVISPSFVLVTD